MARMQIRSKLVNKVLLGLCGILLVYLTLLRKKPYTVVISRTFTEVKPQELWEYVANFANQKSLNPTIDSFEIQYEKGNYDLWEYGVLVHEHLAQLPSIPVTIESAYYVIPAKNANHPYIINSYHTSCVLGYCVGTNASMTFEPMQGGKSTRVTETMIIECPPILSSFCLSDNRKQKDMIYDKLEEAAMTISF